MIDRLRREEGQTAPIVMVLMWALALTAMALAQGGKVGLLDSEATTGADAAALAGARALADDLRGPGGLLYLVTGNPPQNNAYTAAQAYAASNDTTLEDMDITARGKFRLRVTADTETTETLGQPALTDEMQDHQGASRGAAEVTFQLLGPGQRGCLTGFEVEAIADRIGVDVVPEGSGLEKCGGADVRNLQPVLQDAVVELESFMGHRVIFSSGFRTLEEQIALYEGPNPYPVAEPGTSWHESGAAFDASNWNEIKNTIAEHPEQVDICWPYGDYDEVHFSHDDFAECGGPLPRPDGGTKIVIDDVELVDPAT